MTDPSTSIRARWAALGAAVAVTLGAAGIGSYNLVSADVSDGDRSIFVPIAPCRLADTRPAPNNVGPRKAKLAADETLTITAHGSNGECTGASAIPPDANALALNVTALGATSQTFLTFWGDGPNPGTANLNPAPGQPPTPNAVNTPLSDAGTFNLYNERGEVNVVIDVNGYYAPHDHDDRYAKLGDVYPKSETYSQAEVDALVDPAVDLVRVNPYGFLAQSPESDAWEFDLVLTHLASASSECVFQPVELPAGRSLDSVTLNYFGNLPGAVSVGLLGSSAYTGDISDESLVIHNVQGEETTLAAAPGGVVASTVIDLPDGEVVKPGFTYTMAICTQIEIGITAVSISTPEA